MTTGESTRWELWTRGDAPLSATQMLVRVSEDLDRHDEQFELVRGEIRRMTGWLAAAALSFMGATVAFVFNLVR